MSRGLWVDAGNDYDPAKGKLYGITTPYFDVRDPRVTKTYLAGVGGGGIYMASQGEGWPSADTTSPEAWADWANDELKPVDLGSPDKPRVILDNETHDVEWLLAMFKRYRKHRGQRVTAWTLEAFQGGLFTRLDALTIAGFLFTVAPSAYRGNMEPYDPVDVVKDLAVSGFAAGMLTVMYDAATLEPARPWSGFAFTQGRLR